MRRFLMIGLALYACVALAQGPRFDGVRINLFPSPSVVPADGKTTAVIRSELRDAVGRPVVDGTTVVFRIEGGSLSLGGDERRQAVTTTTMRGSATVYATSDTPGVATVYAEVTSGQGKNEVTIAFVEEGSPLLGRSGAVYVRGGWVGYATEQATIQAWDNAEVEFGGVRVIAEDTLQLDVNTLVVKATSARVEVGDASIAGDELRYDLVSGQGLLLRLGEQGVERLCFDCYSLAPREPDERVVAEQLRLDDLESPTWFVAKGISIYPHEKVVLREATLYSGTEKLLSLPKYWVIAMPGYIGTTHSSVLGVNSQGQLAIDFPYFYQVTETQTGAIKLQHGAAAGSVIARDDWSMAIEQAYEDGTAQGAASVIGLPRNDWGFEWRDQRRMGPQRNGYFTAYSPDHESWYLDGNVYQWSGSERVNVTASIQMPRDEGTSYATGIDWLSASRPLGLWDASFRIGTSAGMRHTDGYDSGLVGTHQMYGAVDLPRRFVGERTSLTPSFSDLFSWDTSGFQQNSLRGELRMRQVISSETSAMLSYQAQLTSGDAARGYEHLLNLDLRSYHGTKWSSFLTSTYNLNDRDLYAFGLIDYYVNADWRVGLAATYYQVTDGGYDDYEVTIARRLGATEVGLRWSEQSGRIALELGDFGGLGTF